MISKKKIFAVVISSLLLVIAVITIFNILKLPKEKVPRIAIVIDDLGYNLRDLNLVYNIEKPLTLAILPNIAYSKKTALESAQKGYEVILHLPLEPYEKDAPLEAHTIRVDMAKDEVLSQLNNAIDSVPTLKGVSNHMGSKATENSALIRLIFGELKKRKLYFLDTIVTSKSTCRVHAKEQGIKFAERNIYLDNMLEKNYIKNQFRILVEKARRNGSSIGIGHYRSLTLVVLAEEMDRFEKEGVRFVFVSELVN